MIQAISSLSKEAVLASPDIVARLRLVALELHCVMTWGDSFRPVYRSLHVLRNRIPRNIPRFGASATLRPNIFNVCLEQGGFQKNTHIIYESLNRDNIYCDLRQMQFSAGSVKNPSSSSHPRQQSTVILKEPFNQFHIKYLQHI